MGCRILLVTRLGSSLGISGDHSGLAVADIRHADAIESAIAELHLAGHRVVITGSDDDADDLHTIAGRAKVRTRKLFDDALINPLAFFDVSDEAKRSGYYAKNTYDVNENQYGATLGGKLLGEYGGGVEGGNTTKDLTNAEFWDGEGFSDRPDCDV